MRRSFTDTRHQRRLVAGTISTIVVMTSLAGLRPLGATALAQMPRTQSSMMQQRSLKLMTWNVNGIRSVLKYEAKREQLEQLLATEKPDVTFLQEHRLQEKHVQKDGKRLLKVFDEALPDRAPHSGVWACSTSKLGYSGSCAIYHGGAGVVHHSHGEVDDLDSAEGRTVRLDLACGLSVVGAYVPNAMSDLNRLDYRTSGWDRSMQAYLADLCKQHDPTGKECNVVLCGDLNVAHQDVDFFNSADARTQKQPGTTLEERRSFETMLEELGMADVWRSQHPNTTNAYTFWSARTRARNGNRGMRLDYFLAPQKMLPLSWRTDVTDEADEHTGITIESSEILPDVTASDHCPVVCTLKLP